MSFIEYAFINYEFINLLCLQNERMKYRMQSIERNTEKKLSYEIKYMTKLTRQYEKSFFLNC